MSTDGPRTDWSTTSYSELTKLTECEEAWFRRYVERQTDPGNAPLWLGTAVHGYVQAWWSGGSELDCVLAAQTALQLGHPDAPMLEVDSVLDHARWLGDRYARHYAASRRDVEVVQTELRLETPIPGTDRRLVTKVDQLWRINGKLWGVETKTMGKWDKIEMVDFDPQPTLNDWALKQNGYATEGLFYDAIRTYRYVPKKPTQGELLADTDLEFPTKKAATEWARAAVEAHPGVERPLADSFELIPLTRETEQHEQTLAWVRSVLRRRDTLVRPAQGSPIKHIGRDCPRCPFAAECLDTLAFADEIGLDI